jgi:hypothetical protein
MLWSRGLTRAIFRTQRSQDFMDEDDVAEVMEGGGELSREHTASLSRPASLFVMVAYAMARVVPQRVSLLSSMCLVGVVVG